MRYRFVRSDYRCELGVVMELRSSLQWLSLVERCTVARLTLMYKIVHGLADVNIDHLLKDMTTQTRIGTGQFTFQHIAVNTDIYNNSFYQRTIPEWNSLPIDVCTASSAEKFKSKIAQVDIKSLVKNPHYQ